MAKVRWRFTRERKNSNGRGGRSFIWNWVSRIFMPQRRWWTWCAMMWLIEPGDEGLFPDPSFPIYPSFARGLGATAVPYGLEERNKFQPDPDDIVRKITPRTTVLIFNSPNNPTGTVFSGTVLEEL